MVIPPEYRTQQKHLTGEQDFQTLQLSPVEAANLAVYINLHLSQRKNAVPEFIRSSSEACNELYRVIQHLYDERDTITGSECS